MEAGGSVGRLCPAVIRPSVVKTGGVPPFARWLGFVSRIFLSIGRRLAAIHSGNFIVEGRAGHLRDCLLGAQPHQQSRARGAVLTCGCCCTSGLVRY